ncbi:MAG: menaquinone biosynthesis protein [Phycisphaerales bacterium]|jgi:chorismate dehydratase|nr:menaquinone biosynthesis protein [Phycisphaerales bacterium]
MNSVHVAAVGYLNTLPLIAGLERCSGIDLHRAPPASLVGLLERGEARVALVSLIDAARSDVPLSILPVGIIGCDGPTLTVRVSSRVPPSEIRVLHADVESHTSVALARVVLARRFGVRPAIEPFGPAEREHARTRGEWPESVLLIGDKVITEPPPADDFPHRVDLGEAWKALTSMPFVYASWMCRTEDERNADVARTASLLDRQRRLNAQRLGSLITRGAAEHRWPVSTARTYLTDLLRYEPDERAWNAARTFLAMCAEEGLIDPSRAEPRFAPFVTPAHA